MLKIASAPLYEQLAIKPEPEETKPENPTDWGHWGLTTGESGKIVDSDRDTLP